MAVSKVQIANLALSHLGKSDIQSFEEASAEARQVRLWYDVARKQCLEAYDWGFARKRLALALHGDDAPSGIWTYRYQYPADCVKARALENALGWDADAIPFSIEASEDGSTLSILTDLESAVLIYTWDLQATELFPLTFVDAMSHLLAAYMAMSLTGKRDLRGDEIQLFGAILRNARGQDANQGVERGPREAPWISGR